MPSFRRRSSVTDTEGIEPTRKLVDVSDAADALALAEEAEAEAAEAEAAAAAARARARAIRLRREAQAAKSHATNGGVAAVGDAPEGEAETANAPEAEAGDETVVPDTPDVAGHEPEDSSGRRWGLVLKIVAMTLAVLCTVALLIVSVLIFKQHRDTDAQHRMQAEYAAAGRQSVVTLMSLDFTNAEGDVKRIIENSTGEFKTDFEKQAGDFVKVARDSKVISDVTVTATAVESMDPDKAVVLVAATSRVTNAAGANEEPRAWRLSVNLQREGGQIKMAKVEFVP